MDGVSIWECWSPVIQGGFAVFSVFLLGIIVWLIKQLLKVLGETNTVLAGNTKAIEAIGTGTSETQRLMADIRDQLLTRPCLVRTQEQST